MVKNEGFNAKPQKVKIDLHAKQARALDTEATEVLYGGAAGGGKSFLLRVAAIAWCYDIPGLQVYLFRRTSPDLIYNHLHGASNFHELLSVYVQQGAVTITSKPAKIAFANGSAIHLCHCQHEQDMYDYQGAEIHVLMIDELTHFTESIYRFLRNRVRLGGLQIPEKYKGVFPRILCGSNPGGLGHTWVKGTFIDYAQPLEVKRAEKDDGGMLRQFIPALLEDNPTQTVNDPNYEDRLTGLGSPDLVQAMRYGNWDIVAGAALEKIRRTVHLVRDFAVPRSWTKFTVIDWGSSKPYAVGWFCVCDDNLILKAKDGYPEKFVPKGALIMYREMYGWNGKPDEGNRLESFEVARMVLDVEDEEQEEVDYRIGDSAMWAEHDGPSTQERMFDGTDGRYRMVRCRKDRISNYQEIRARLVGEEGHPMLYAAASCRHFWRTVPNLQLDDLHPEKGPDSAQEDHIYDVVAYACASRPYITTERERNRDAFDRAKKEGEKAERWAKEARKRRWR